MTNSVVAAEITGQGWGDTEAAAKREALLDISSRISVTVRNTFKSTQKILSQSTADKKLESVQLTAENSVETNSELPILGANFVMGKEGGQISVKAILETARSLPLYERRLAELGTRMLALNEGVAKSKSGEAQYNNIMDIFTLLDEFKKLNTVATYLGGKTQQPGVDEDTLRGQLHGVSKQVDSLDLAAKVLTQGMNETGVFIFPAKARNSNEVTPFAALIKDKMSAHLKVAASPKDAAYLMTGEYEESEYGIDITYHLIDNTSIAKKTNTVHIPKAVYAGIHTEPKVADFEKLLKAGVAVSGNLRVDVSTNMGSHDLLFNEGQEVELFVKLSEMGYFYVVGHTLKEGENNSYLLEVSEAKGPRKFIKFVNADDANKWISIGKFQVSPPYGVEGLQVLASNKDFAEALPATYLDKDSGLYLVSNSAKEGVIKTRALVKKFSTVAQMSEATLMFTTLAK